MPIQIKLGIRAAMVANATKMRIARKLVTP